MKQLVFFRTPITIIAHLLFWLGVYFFYTYFLGYGSSNIKYVNYFSVCLMPVTITISYFFFSFLIPNYLVKNKKTQFIIYTIYTFIISFFFVNLSILYSLIFLEYLKPEKTSPITKTLPIIILGVYFIVFIFISIGLIINNFKSTVRNEKLNTKFLQTQLQLKEQELKFLKMQIHPHFLFNSLNTIYGYTLQKSNHAPEMILKLSNLLDYILYQIQKPTVLLTDEINHINDYIDLEKMRFHDSLKITFNNSVLNESIQIAPMVLIPFIENSFKHGSFIDGKLSIKISLNYSNDQLFFSVINSSNEHTETNNGIGLKNIQKRLKMLYPNAHSLQITKEKRFFKITLIITPTQLKRLKNE